MLGNVREIAEGFVIHLLGLSLSLTAAKCAEGLIDERFDQGVPAWRKTALDESIDSRDGGLMQAKGHSLGRDTHVALPPGIKIASRECTSIVYAFMGALVPQVVDGEHVGARVAGDFVFQAARRTALLDQRRPETRKIA